MRVVLATTTRRPVQITHLESLTSSLRSHFTSGNISENSFAQAQVNLLSFPTSTPPTSILPRTISLNFNHNSVSVHPLKQAVFVLLGTTPRLHSGTFYLTSNSQYTDWTRPADRLGPQESRCLAARVRPTRKCLRVKLTKPHLASSIYLPRFGRQSTSSCWSLVRIMYRIMYLSMALITILPREGGLGTTTIVCFQESCELARK